MKHYIFLLVLVIGLISTDTLFAQSWKRNLPTDKKGDYTFFDYQKAFNEYWKPYNVEGGYYINKKGEKIKAAGYKQFKRWEWYWAPRVDQKTGEFPQKSAFDIWKDYKKTKGAKSIGGTWTSIGDHELDAYSDPGALQESGTGRINCATFDPNDNNHFWVGAPSGGLWETKDGGASWTCKTDNEMILGVSDIALSPNYSTDKTIYIATGDRDAGDDPSLGVLKSTDDGATWFRTDLKFKAGSNSQAVRVIVDPSNANNIYVATSVGFYKSTDAGVNFYLKQNGDFIDMDMILGSESGAGGADLIATTNTANAQAWRSTDAGETWTATFTAANSEEDRCDIAVTSANSNYVYLITAWDGGAIGSIYRSTNGGASFSEVYDGATKNNLFGWNETNTRSDGGQGFYDVTLAVSSSNENVVYVGGVNAYISTNGASSFVFSNRWDPAAGGTADEVHADHHNAYFRPSDDRLFDCNDGGLYYTDNAGSGSGANWVDITDGLITGQVYDIGVSQTEAGSIVAGFQDNGGKYRDISTSATDWEQIREGDGTCCATDPTDVNIQWMTYPNGTLYQTTDEWANYSGIVTAPNAAWAAPVEADPLLSDVVYIGGLRVIKVDGGTATYAGTEDKSSALLSMDVYNDGTNLVIWTGNSNDLFKSDLSGGGAYTSVYSGLHGNRVTDIAIDDDDYNHVYVSLGGYDYNTVYETTDGGSTWTDISSGLPPVPAGAIVINEQNTTENEIYVGTDLGVFVKVGNDDWRLFNDGFPVVSITDLEIYYDSNPDNSKLYAATYGRDTWESDLYIVDASSMTYVSSTVFQNNPYDVFQGTVKNEIIGIEVVTNGSSSPLDITSFSLNTSGSTDAATDISNAKLYYTATSNVFSTTNQFGSTVNSPNGNFNITGTQILRCGKNYFWLTYDIAGGATENDYVDAECTSLTIGTAKTPTTTAPVGYRQIVAGVYCDSYSSNLVDGYGISKLVFNTINNGDGSTTSGHYNDYTAQSTTVNAGSSYDLDVTLKTGSNTFYATAWIDWNHDYDFDDAGETFNLGSNASDGLASNCPYSVPVPNDALGGDTRMRIVATFDSPATSCGEYRYGETEDYTVNVIPNTPPEITSVDITSGTAYKDGGKDIVISGTNLSGATSVTVAGVNARIISNTATKIDIETAGGAYSGANQLVVTNAVGSDSEPLTFTYSTRNTIPVNGGTDSDPTIQDALDNLYSWKGTTEFTSPITIEVYSGTYNETVTPNVNLSPTGDNQLIIQNHTGESPIINATGLNNGMYIGNLDNVIIKGFTVYGANNDNVYSEGDYNTISFIKSYGSVGGSGIYLNGANSSITNNLCYGNYEHGIYVNGSNNTIKNNTADDNGHSLIGPQTSIYSYSGSESITDKTISYADILVPDNVTVTNVRVLNMNITHTYDADLDIYLLHPDATEVELSTGNGGSGNNYTNTNFDDASGNSIKSGSAPFTGTYSPEGDLSDFDTKASNGTWRLKVYDGGNGDNGTITSWQLEITYTANDYAGAGLYIESGTNNTVQNNILVAKTGSDNYYALKTETGITANSNYNTYYTTNTNLFDYNGTVDNTGPIGSNDLTTNPLLLGSGNYHLQSTYGSYTEVAKSPIWPPEVLSGGDWSLDALDSPAIDAGNPADDFSKQPSGSSAINQGAYGNTPQAARSPGFLPIELFSFKAERVSSQVVLRWETASEYNNDYFTIERSTNAIDFNPIEKVEGAGNSNNILNYEVTDINPFSGTSYYRLKQTDFDGKYSYSYIVSVNKGNDNLFEKPFNYYVNNQFLYIKLNENYFNMKLVIADITGRKLFNKNIPQLVKSEKFKINIGRLEQGFYNFILFNNTKKFGGKFIIK